MPKNHVHFVKRCYNNNVYKGKEMKIPSWEIYAELTLNAQSEQTLY